MTPCNVLSDYDQLRDITLEVSKKIASMHNYLTENPEETGTLEIEARLGRYKPNGEFSCNVGHDTFVAILALLESFPRWNRTLQWSETHDVFYSMDAPSPLRGNVGTGKTARVQVRSSVGADPEHPDKLSIRHVSKRKLWCVGMEPASMDTGSCSITLCCRPNLACNFDARICASIEHSIPEDLLPVAVTPELVRIKQRRSFRLASLGVEPDAFSFDLSIVYSGKTKSEAEQKQANNWEPSFEVEVECLCPRDYLKSCAGEDTYLALSLVLKIHDFLVALNPQQAVTFVPRHQEPVLRGARPAEP